MVLQDDADRVKHLLAEAISVLCKNGLTFESELCVEGLLGITLDNSDILLVNISESITNEGRRQQQTSATKSRISLSKDKPPPGRQIKKRGHTSVEASPEPSAKRSNRSGKSSAELFDIKTEKLSVADDDSSYAGDGDEQDDIVQDMKCTRCGKMFDNPANLERHLREIHFVGVVWLCCQSCDFSHVSMKHFNYHMFRQHRKVGGRKRFPHESKFLTPQQIKYRIEHNMRVPDVSDNKPKAAAEKSGSRSQPASRNARLGTSLRRTPARLSADATRRIEKAQPRITDKSRVSIKTEPNNSKGSRSLRHRDTLGQVVAFSKNLKGALRRKSAPPAPATPRTAKPATPKITPKVTPRSKVVLKEEKKSTPRREQKKETPKKPEKKATPRRDDKKKTAVAQDKKKTPVANRRGSITKPVVKKKAIVSPKKAPTKKPLNDQKQRPKKRTPAKKEKIVWPEGVSVKEFEIKLDQLDLSTISLSGNESDTLKSPEKKNADKSPNVSLLKDNIESLAELPSENRNKGKIVGDPQPREKGTDDQEPPSEKRKDGESVGDHPSTEEAIEKDVDAQEGERKERTDDQPVDENTSDKVSSSDAHDTPETEKDESETPEKEETEVEEKSDESRTEAESPMELDSAEKRTLKSIKETLKEQYSQSREQLSSEQVSSTTREEKSTEPVEQVTADTTEGSGNEGEEAQSSEPMETEETAKEAENTKDESKSTEQQEADDKKTDETEKETEGNEDEVCEELSQPQDNVQQENDQEDEASTPVESIPSRSDKDDTGTSSRTSPRARTSPSAKESPRVHGQPVSSEPVDRVERDLMAEDMPFIPPGSPVRSQPYYQQPPPPLPPSVPYHQQYPQYPPQYSQQYPNNRGNGRGGQGGGYYYGHYNPYNPYNNQ